MNTSRNIEEVRKKLQTLSTKAPLKIGMKYFRKEVPGKLEEMNKTLKKMSEMKSKPKYEMRMLRRLGKSQTGDIVLALSNSNSMIVAVKTFRKEKVKVEYLIDEMKIHLYCTHPNILPAYGYHLARDEVFLVI